MLQGNICIMVLGHSDTAGRLLVKREHYEAGRFTGRVRRRLSY